MKFDEFKIQIIYISQQRSQIKQVSLIAALFEDVLNMNQEEARADFKDLKMKELKDTIAIINSGYSSITSEGTIVDRRIHPDAIPIKENKTLNIPPSIDIWKKGNKVKFVESSIEQVKWGDNDNPELVCNTTDIYTIAKVEVHNWHTKLYLEGIEGKFNSVSFKLVIDDTD